MDVALPASVLFVPHHLDFLSVASFVSNPKSVSRCFVRGITPNHMLVFDLLPKVEPDFMRVWRWLAAWFECWVWVGDCVAQHFCLGQRGEDFEVEQFIAQAAVEALAAGVLQRAAWLAIHSRTALAMNSGTLSLQMNWLSAEDASNRHVMSKLGRLGSVLDTTG